MPYAYTLLRARAGGGSTNDDVRDPRGGGGGIDGHRLGALLSTRAEALRGLHDGAGAERRTELHGAVDDRQHAVAVGRDLHVELGALDRRRGHRRLDLELRGAAGLEPHLAEEELEDPRGPLAALVALLIAEGGVLVHRDLGAVDQADERLAALLGL